MSEHSPPRSSPPIWPWLNRAPGGAPRGVAAGEHLWPRFSAWCGHSHVYAAQPYPGAPAFAYEALGLSEYSPIGAGTANRDQLRHFEGTAFAGPSSLTQGLGGLVQGQYASAPLVVTTPAQAETLDLEMYSAPEPWIGG